MKKHEHDRITFNGSDLDEVVTHGGTLHIEALDAHNFMIIWWDEDGERIHLRGRDLELLEHTGTSRTETPVPETTGPPLSYCGRRWLRLGTVHTCTGEALHRDRHVCDCEATIKGEQR